MSCFVYHTMSIKVVERVHCNLKQVFVMKRRYNPFDIEIVSCLNFED